MRARERRAPRRRHACSRCGGRRQPRRGGGGGEWGQGKGRWGGLDGSSDSRREEERSLPGDKICAEARVAYALAPLASIWAVGFTSDGVGVGGSGHGKVRPEQGHTAPRAEWPMTRRGPISDGDEVVYGHGRAEEASVAVENPSLTPNFPEAVAGDDNGGEGEEVVAASKQQQQAATTTATMEKRLQLEHRSSNSRRLDGERGGKGKKGKRGRRLVRKRSSQKINNKMRKRGNFGILLSTWHDT
uniref:DUF834 domain-containing protein n=1 Tax=Oryza meridionalis TaxID=40149 RepID=A0A0E0DQ16_9ORYZ